MCMSKRVDLVVHVGGSYVDDVESADLRRRLCEELLAVDVDDVRPLDASAPPPGAKGGAAIVVGALAVSLAPVVMPRLIDVLASWLGRQHPEVEVEIGGQKLRAPVTRAQRNAIVAVFLEQAAGSDKQ
jgi:hypothetical protein